MDATVYFLKQLAVQGSVTLSGFLTDGGPQVEVKHIDRKGHENVSNYAEFDAQVEDLYERALRRERAD
jgi:hypothetical protein